MKVTVSGNEPTQQQIDDLRDAAKRTLITGRCAACKHWDASGGEYPRYDDDGEDVVLGHRACKAVPHLYGVEAGTEPAAFVLDASGYSAKLWTLPAFGCALWSQRDPVGDAAEAGGER